MCLGLVDRVQRVGVEPFEPVQICTVMRHIRFVVLGRWAIGGLLKDYRPTVLTAGTPGHRYLFRHSILAPALSFATELAVSGRIETDPTRLAGLCATIPTKGVAADR